MTSWLSSAWEPNWRSFQYYNLYRLVVAALIVAGVAFSPAWLAFFHIPASGILDWVAGLYLLTILAGIVLSIARTEHFEIQLTVQVMADVVAIGLSMYAAGGVSSGLGVLLLVSLGAASLVGRGRLVLFYAATATLAVLSLQINGILERGFEPGSIVQAGFLSAGFFTTAVLARLLGQRLMANEELSRQQGIALENQSRISQRVIERTQDGVLVVGRDGLVMRKNPEAINMLGKARQEEARLADYSVQLSEGFAAWLLGGGPETVVFAGASGRELWARFERTDSSDGESLVFLEDIGRIQDQAQQLKLAALGRLTASIAHEIRNPLAAISHAGDLLREERRGEMQDRLLRILNDNVRRLDRIVTDILELGRRDRAQPERLAVADVLAAYVADYVHAEQVDPQVIVLTAESGLVFCFDRSHLHQVLWNLVGNALRHSSRQPGSVRLVANACSDATRVELHVIDDGPGVAEEHREQVFEPFFTTHVKGTGLGLFIARELCEANSASLELAPEAGCGHFIIVGRNDTCL